MKSAPQILTAAADAIADRAASRDVAAERSMARTVKTFAALTGHNINEREGWVFMAVLKLARAQAGALNPDDYVDGAAYIGLAGECAENVPTMPLEMLNEPVRASETRRVLEAAMFKRPTTHVVQLEFSQEADIAPPSRRQK
ncbi:DUF6378 domain-containing protein [Flagellatimonas centrodinii]|uniref:DUF6378 domain-containing protein n=1 Tax=Flagellatimonas centrodinii TaxID=2806210 RepID=UPI001FEF89B0|nr:DUF6378 domain-containing protein [Flagellatimonas centrodinii]ULQ45937.1 DUF6378 domain-containing protein [Flagellatimonas centrodinii]